MAKAATLAASNYQANNTYPCGFGTHTDSTPSMSVFVGYGDKLWAYCHSCKQRACLEDGLSFTVLRKKRRKSHDTEIYDDPPIPDTIHRRIDSTLNYIRENNEELPNALKWALSWRGLTLDCLKAHDVTYTDDLKITNSLKYSYSWLIPVKDKDGFHRAVKLHFERRKEGSKSKFLPVGTGRGEHNFLSLFPLPTPKSDNWFFLTSGELKALALICSGFEATSSTMGEGRKLTRWFVDTLSARNLCIVYDDDEAGRKFSEYAKAVLKTKVAKLKRITFGKNADGKKRDANDIAREEGALGLRAKVQALLDQAKEEQQQPFDIATKRIEVAEVLEKMVDAPPGTVEVCSSIVGLGKSHAISAIAKKSKRKFAIFVEGHQLAKEYEKRLDDPDNVIRLLSPKRMTAEAPEGGMLPCPHLDEIEGLQSRGYSYGSICNGCVLKGHCPVFQRKEKAESASILILQHAHLKLVDAKPVYTKDRIRVIDENCIKYIRDEEKFSPQDITIFKAALDQFQIDSKYAVTDLPHLRQILCSLESLSDGQFVTLDPSKDRLTESLIRQWGTWSAKSTPSEGRNLMPILDHAADKGRWIRREGEEFVTLRESIPDHTEPLVLLDATMEKMVYDEIFKGRNIRYWPEEDMPAPVSQVIQLNDGAYPLQSLMGEDGKYKCFKDICKEVRQIVDTKTAYEWTDVGIITLNKLEGMAKMEFPDIPRHQFLHYGGLKGLNVLKDCEFIVIIGSMPIPPEAFARRQRIIFDKNMPLSEIIAQNAPAIAKMRLSDDIGPATDEVGAIWTMTVKSELIQAIGRGRPYETRDAKKQQQILIYCNEPLAMPMTKILSRDEMREQLGMETNQDKVMGRVIAAMTRLKYRFTLEELAAEMGLKKTSLKQAFYQQPIQACLAQLRLKAELIPDSDKTLRYSYPIRDAESLRMMGAA